MFVFCYLTFDVLDLDLSDFPLRPAPLSKRMATAIIPKPKEPQRALVAVSAVQWIHDLQVLSSILPALMRLYKKKKGPKISPAFNFRVVHHYRIGLPRSSIIEIPSIV
jgi:hypothetical protein